MELRDLKVGDFVRTKYGISQYKYYDTPRGTLLCIPVKDGSQGIFANIEDIINVSDKLIDLVCEGDYINGMKVKDNDGEYIVLDKIINNGSSLSYLEICESDIKTIITNEQIDRMSYKAGE